MSDRSQGLASLSSSQGKLSQLISSGVAMMQSLGRPKYKTQRKEEVLLTEAEANLLELDDEESKLGDKTIGNEDDDESSEGSVPSYVNERPRRGRPAFRPFDLPSRQPLKRSVSSLEHSEESGAPQVAV